MADVTVFTQQMVERFTQMARRNEGASFSDQRWPETLKLANTLEHWLGATPSQRILDLACGTGAPTVALALRGYEMTGIDLTPAMLEVARRGAAARGARVAWLCQDMRALSYCEEFDHIMLRDVVFGVFEDEREDAELVRQIARALKRPGKCLLEVYNKEFAMVHGVEHSHLHDARSDRFIAKDPADGLRSFKLYSRQEWQQMLASNGLTITFTTGWKWPGDPEPPPWRADILVAEKPAC